MKLILIAVSFGVISLAAKQIGASLQKYKLPLISGYLLAGILAGPFVLKLLTQESISQLLFIDEIALAFIAFAAGNELVWKEYKNRLKSIGWITAGLVFFTFVIGSLGAYLLSDLVPFMKDLPPSHKFAISIMFGAILVARSPSSAIAIIRELRAKGPFTQTTLGVTVVMDVGVILLFSLTTSTADAIFEKVPFDLEFIYLLLGELLLSFFAAYILSLLLNFILRINLIRAIKSLLILSLGYSVFLLSTWMRKETHNLIGFEILLEPLLICMIASFLVTNTSKYRVEFFRILHDMGPTIYLIFFTLTGASIAIDIFFKVWGIALTLFLIRILGIFIGSRIGGLLAKDPPKQNNIAWMAYITQAGVGLGLAKEVAVEFPHLGSAFATLIISVIVINQLVGPPLYKKAIRTMGEAHEKGAHEEFDGVRDAIIFGVDDQSLALARELLAHEWQIKIAYTPENGVQLESPEADLDLHPIQSIDIDALKQLDTEHSDAIVGMLPDDQQNFKLCELVYEHFGIENVIVRVNQRDMIDKFHEIDVLTVHPSTAMVNLLNHFVRSPMATSLLLGIGDDKDIIEIKITNKEIDGLTLQNLRLPLDVRILQICRDDQIIISQGYTRLRLGDDITLLGSSESLQEVISKFES